MRPTAKAGGKATGPFSIRAPVLSRHLGAEIDVAHAASNTVAGSGLAQRAAGGTTPGSLCCHSIVYALSVPKSRRFTLLQAPCQEPCIVPARCPVVGLDDRRGGKDGP